MAFLTAIYAFIADVTIFGVTFTRMQMIGLAASLLIYVAQLVYFIREAKIQAAEKAAEAKEAKEDDEDVERGAPSFISISVTASMLSTASTSLITQAGKGEDK